MEDEQRIAEATGTAYMNCVNLLIWKTLPRHAWSSIQGIIML